MKTNICILLVLFIFYLVVAVYLIIKLIDIKRKPDKYAEAELNKRANELEFSRSHFGFFKSLSHQYSMINLIFYLILNLLSFLLIFVCNKLCVGSNSGIFIGMSYIGGCVAILINVPLGVVIIPLHIKTDFFAVSVLDSFNCEGRDKIFYCAYLFFAVLFILGFPFIILACNNYASYDDKGIYYSGYFQLDETYTSYEEVECVSISIHHNNSGKVDVFQYYITLNNGKSVNLNNPNTGCNYFTDEIFQIHKYIESNDKCIFNITPLNEIDINFIETKLSEERAATAYYIFEGRH